MGFGDLLKDVGRTAANGFLDSYERESKRLGKDHDVSILNDLVNGKVDWSGNPIDKNDDN